MRAPAIGTVALAVAALVPALASPAAAASCQQLGERGLVKICTLGTETTICVIDELAGTEICESIIDTCIYVDGDEKGCLPLNWPAICSTVYKIQAAINWPITLQTAAAPETGIGVC